MESFANFALFVGAGILKLLFAWAVLHAGRLGWLVWHSVGVLSFEADRASTAPRSILPAIPNRVAKSTPIQFVPHYLFGRNFPVGPILYFEVRFVGWKHWETTQISVIVPPRVLRSLFMNIIEDAQQLSLHATFRVGSVQLHYVPAGVSGRCSTYQHIALQANHVQIGLRYKGLVLTIKDVLTYHRYYFPTAPDNQQQRVFQGLRLAIP